MKKRGIIILTATLAMAATLSLMIKDVTSSANATSQVHTSYGGGFGFGLVRDGEGESDLYSFSDEEFNSGKVNISIFYEGAGEREFTITPLLNGEPISVNFNNEGFRYEYNIDIRNGQNIVGIETDNIGDGVLSFIAKGDDTVFGIYGYSNYENIDMGIRKIKYDRLNDANSKFNYDIVGYRGEETEYSFKVKLDEERFKGDNYGYKVFIDNKLVKIDGKWGKIFKRNKDVLQDTFKFNLPKERGQYDLYIVRSINPISNVNPHEEIIFKSKIIVN